MGPFACIVHNLPGPFLKSLTPRTRPLPPRNPPSAPKSPPRAPKSQNARRAGNRTPFREPLPRSSIPLLARVTTDETRIEHAAAAGLRAVPAARTRRRLRRGQRHVPLARVPVGEVHFSPSPRGTLRVCFRRLRSPRRFPPFAASRAIRWAFRKPAFPDQSLCRRQIPRRGDSRRPLAEALETLRAVPRTRRQNCRRPANLPEYRRRARFTFRSGGTLFASSSP